MSSSPCGRMTVARFTDDPDQALWSIQARRTPASDSLWTLEIDCRTPAEIVGAILQHLADDLAHDGAPLLAGPAARNPSHVNYAAGTVS
ncbi:DUF317 domain-containing protein [Kitasatospora sp. NE20-6]|uniref:DUF317 domain-containing protein n=1 Tax=Kitasatospora sp. NE20-6 TaxID=2859066 RepID=UPI0038B2EEB1